MSHMLQVARDSYGSIRTELQDEPDLVNLNPRSYKS